MTIVDNRPVDLKALNARFFQSIKNDKALLQRCNAYCVQKHEKTLVEYLSNGTAPEDKAALLNELISIVEGGDLTKLPPLPGGQAVEPQTTAPTPAPKLPAPAPAPKAEAPATTLPAPSSKAQELLAKIRAKKEEEAKAAAEAAAAAAAAAAPKLDEEAVKALIADAIAEAGIPTEDRIRELIREELDKALAPIVEALG